jgi:hypothetical protein
MMKRIDLVHASGQWVAKSGREELVHAGTKEQAVKETRMVAEQMGGASVRIHTKDGRIQEERTYPRSADPRGSKG